MEIRYSYKAARQLDDLPILIKQRLIEKMRFFALQENPLTFAKSIQIEKLYRFRVGNYRIVFQLKQKMIFVVIIGKRDKIYT